MRTTGIFEWKSTRPEYVPFYVFEGRLRGEFTGVLEYKRRESYTDSNGKTQTRVEYDEYARVGIPFRGRAVGAETRTDGATPCAIYAGFDFRRQYVEGALHPGMSDATLSRAVPLNQAESPPLAGVGAFTMKPSFAFAKAHERLRAIAHADASTLLYSGELDHLEFRRRRGGGLLAGLFGGGVACPKNDWVQPDRRFVQDLAYEVEGARLHGRGVVLMPVWVVEYTYSGEAYRCFVSGVDGRVSRIPHLL